MPTSPMGMTRIGSRPGVMQCPEIRDGRGIGNSVAAPRRQGDVLEALEAAPPPVAAPPLRLLLASWSSTAFT